MCDANSERDPVEALATEFIERIRRGEQPTVEEYARQHPTLADAIRGLFPTIAQMERLKTHNEPTTEGAASLGGPRPETLGDFHIIREIGRGGMGVVYEAEQQSLQRRVAVKVLPRTSTQNPRLLQRFHREARIAAGLHHTNIVPVFGVGEEDDYHYIVMQLIAGVGLDEILLRLGRSRRSTSAAADGLANPPESGSTKRLADAANAARMLIETNIEHSDAPHSSLSGGAQSNHSAGEPHTLFAEALTDDLDERANTTNEVGAVPPLSGREPPVDSTDLCRFGPTYWRNVAHIGVRVADALRHAHERDVLHRDIKPSNLILDRRGIVWVTDFGLAKAMQDDSVSRTGDIVGTLRYLAPERLRGEADARSDICSLGLTLYEMLALRPPYEAPDASSLMRKISAEPPAKLAVVAAGIPRDLETIVMKAVAREPAHRYQSADDMADDLRRFLDDRPIRARRVSSVEHLWRWCRRNPAVAALTATAIGLLVLVAMVTSIGYVVTTTALDREQVQRHKADATTNLALEALDDIFEQFDPDRMSAVADISLDDTTSGSFQATVQPVLSKEAAALLERLLVFYDKLAAQSDGDPALRRKSADANRRVGDIRAALGQFKQAEAAYLTAVDTYRQIEEYDPTNRNIAVEIARIYNSLGELQVPAGTSAECRPFHLKALDAIERVAQTADPSPALRFEFARTCYSLGQGSGPPPMLLDSRPPSAGAPPDLEFGGPHEMPQDRPPPDDPFSRQRPGGPGPPPDPHQQEENEQYLRRAVELLEQLVKEQPTIPDYQHLLACCYRDLPPVRAIDLDNAEGRQTDRAIEILSRLVERFPANPTYRVDLVKTYIQAALQRGVAPGMAAVDQLTEALSVAQELVAEHPNVPVYALAQVQVYLALSKVLTYEEQPAAAEAALRNALSLQSLLVSRFPDNMPHKIWKAMIEISLAESLAKRTQGEAARALLVTAIAELHSVQKDGQDGPHQGLLGRSYEILAAVYRQLGQIDRADEAFRQAEQYRGPRRGPPRVPRD